MDAFQKYLNNMLGVTDRVWEEYNAEERTRRKERESQIQKISAKIDGLEQSVNKMIENTQSTDELQMSINKMMGITEETWQKYNPNN